MQFHQIQPIHKSKKKKRVGRGGKHGTYSGKGIKGQKSRAGRKMEPYVRELIKRYPKLRGYRFRYKPTKETIINISLLEEKFKTGDKITPEILINRKIISKIKGRVPEVKILSKGEITKKLTINGCQISKGAREKIEKAGGEIK